MERQLETTPVLIRLPVELWKKMKARARKLEVTRAELARQWLTEKMAEAEDK